MAFPFHLFLSSGIPLSFAHRCWHMAINKRVLIHICITLLPVCVWVLVGSLHSRVNVVSLFPFVGFNFSLPCLCRGFFVCLRFVSSRVSPCIFPLHALFVHSVARKTEAQTDYEAAWKLAGPRHACVCVNDDIIGCPLCVQITQPLWADDLLCVHCCGYCMSLLTRTRSAFSHFFIRCFSNPKFGDQFKIVDIIDCLGEVGWKSRCFCQNWMELFSERHARTRADAFCGCSKVGVNKRPQYLFCFVIIVQNS